MDDNPWLVDSIHSFSVFKCPECIFDSKEEDNFHYHAIQNHPLSFVFFGKPGVEMITEEKSTDLPEKIEVLENSFKVEDNASSFEMEYNDNSFEAKGQIISKCLFGVFNSFQKMNKTTSHTSKN